MSLIVVIGLVLGISGSAYTAIAALRSNWEQTVKDHIQAMGGWREELSQATSQNIVSGRDKHQRRAVRATRFWYWSQWMPMLLLGLASLAMTADVCMLDWHSEEQSFFKNRPTHWCQVYKVGMLVMVAVDILAFYFTYRSYSSICDCAEELGRLFTSAVDSKTAKDTQRVLSNTPSAGTALVARPRNDHDPID